MKTAISISDEVFKEAEEAAKQLGLSRSKLFSRAISEFVVNHKPDVITERLNEIYGKHDSGLDEDITQANYDLLAQEDW
jgi:metal-responsive CopG/Arc/MetJ family transcriptional regulator